MEQGQEGNQMNEAAAPDIAAKLAEATQAMAAALHNINAQFDGLHAKIDRIVAAVEDEELQATAGDEQLRKKLAASEKANEDLKAQAAQSRRKTLSPIVTRLLAKEGIEGEALIEAPVVEKALEGLSIEQRIAVKAELARAGVLI
jgi:hypothetical protein